MWYYQFYLFWILNGKYCLVLQTTVSEHVCHIIRRADGSCDWLLLLYIPNKWRCWHIQCIIHDWLVILFHKMCMTFFYVWYEQCVENTRNQEPWICFTWFYWLISCKDCTNGCTLSNWSVNIGWIDQNSTIRYDTKVAKEYHENGIRVYWSY